MNKKLVKLTEGDLRNIVKSSVNRILREFGSDGPDFENMNFDSASLPDREYKELDPENDLNFLNDYEFLPSMRRGRHVQSANDFDELPESRRRRGKVIKESDDDFNYDAYYRSLKGFLNNPIDINNGDYNPSDEEIMSAMDDLNLDDLDLDLPESKKRMGRIIRESIRRIITEKHRPSGVSRRIHTRDANGKKQSFDYIPNLPKYNKSQEFNQASKFQRINARPVEDPNGEDIDTVLKDGTIERKGLHLPQGYYNVNNVGGTEHWGIDPKTFAKKYEADPEQQGVYKPKGGPMLASNPLKRNTSFQAPWGGRMDMKKGSRILQDPNNPEDTYGIDGEAFGGTYEFDESKKKMGKIIRESINKVLNESGEDYPGDDWRDAYMDDRGNRIQSRGHGPNKKFRTIKAQEPKKQAKQSKKYPSDDWEEAYMDDKGNRIQSKGHGPNKKWRTIKKS